MRIVCIGGGPGGLYLAILLKRADPRHQVTVFERNRPDDTFGWGVVFSNATLDFLARADWESHHEIQRSFVHWDEIDIHYRGTHQRCRGHGFSGIGRARLLEILQRRASGLGVELRFETDIDDETALAPADLIVASDGIHSRFRARYAAHFQPDIEIGRCRYLWLGARCALPAFRFAFEETRWGWFTLHAYRYDEQMSTFIVEAREETWRAAGLEDADLPTSLALCEQLFAPHLAGARLLANEAHPRGHAWLNFQRVLCRRWHRGNLVLLGDAAHTAHFSIGSGTKLAVEDAITLAGQLRACASVGEALARYQDERMSEVLRLQNAARNRQRWFENVARYARLAPPQFAYSLLTGSQRIDHANLRSRDPGFVAGVEGWLTEHTPAAGRVVAPAFLPLRLREMPLANRIVVSPMSMYSAQDGMPNDFHLVHYGARAQGGAGLVLTEMTDVAAEARISPGCAGLYSDAHVAGWKRIVDFVHAHSGARIGVQLGHAGPKGSTQRGWEDADAPLAEGNWPLLGPSATPWGPRSQVPRPMTRTDMDTVCAQFVAATARAIECGFDMIELHCAHGYLLSAFITPLLNRRDDEYGGGLDERLRFPLEVFAAMRAVWPQERPMSVRISATDWVAGGLTAAEAVLIAQRLRAAGCDLISVSTGQTAPQAQPVYGRLFQTPFADQIRNEADIATLAVGNITDIEQAHGIVAAGRADLVALGRTHLADPYFTLHAAARAGLVEQTWPPQYLSGKALLERRRAPQGGEPPG